MSLLFLGENRAIGHHLFFHVLKLCVSFQGQQCIHLGLLLTVHEVPDGHSPEADTPSSGWVEGGLLRKVLLCVDRVDRLTSNWPVVALLLWES